MSCRTDRPTDSGQPRPSFPIARLKWLQQSFRTLFERNKTRGDTALTNGVLTGDPISYRTNIASLGGVNE